MSSFILRFDVCIPDISPPYFYKLISFIQDACRAFHKGTEQPGECDTLLDSLRALRRIATHLESGTVDRLENLARRVGYLQRAGQRKQKESKELDRDTHRRLELSVLRFVCLPMLRRVGFNSPEVGTAPVAFESAKITTRRRESRSRCFPSVATVQNTALGPSNHHFSGLNPISLLSTPRNLTNGPIIQLSIDLHATDPAPLIRRNHNDASTTVYDHKDDPNEIFILPSLSNQPLFSLQSIPELSDDEFEHGPPTPRASSPVLFVNPFGAPSKNGQLPSPPQTPSLLSDGIPPDLNDDEEEEDSLSRSEPINLTGRIKKLMDPPIVGVVVRLMDTCTDCTYDRRSAGRQISFMENGNSPFRKG